MPEFTTDRLEALLPREINLEISSRLGKLKENVGDTEQVRQMTRELNEILYGLPFAHPHDVGGVRIIANVSQGSVPSGWNTHVLEDYVQKAANSPVQGDIHLDVTLNVPFVYGLEHDFLSSAVEQVDSEKNIPLSIYQGVPQRLFSDFNIVFNPKSADSHKIPVLFLRPYTTDVVQDDSMWCDWNQGIKLTPEMIQSVSVVGAGQELDPLFVDYSSALEPAPSQVERYLAFRGFRGPEDRINHLGDRVEAGAEGSLLRLGSRGLWQHMRHYSTLTPDRGTELLSLDPNTRDFFRRPTLEGYVVELTRQGPVLLEIDGLGTPVRKPKEWKAPQDRRVLDTAAAFAAYKGGGRRRVQRHYASEIIDRLRERPIVQLGGSPYRATETECIIEEPVQLEPAEPAPVEP